jgi:hypothetical protein
LPGRGSCTSAEVREDEVRRCVGGVGEGGVEHGAGEGTPNVRGGVHAFPAESGASVDTRVTQHRAASHPLLALIDM